MTNPFGSPDANANDDVFELGDTTEEEKGYRIPAGKYKAKVIDIDKATSKAGNPMWVWTFVMLHGPKAGIGKELKVWTTLSPAAKWKMNQVVNALGLATGGKMKLTKDKIIGKACMVDVEDDEYNGTPSSKIGTCSVIPPKT